MTNDRPETERITTEATSAPAAGRFNPMRTSLTRVQTIVGLTTGMLSITGALISTAGYFTTPPGNGQLVAIVRDRGDRPLRDVAVEVLTPQQALVTTLAPSEAGYAVVPVQQGAYLLRVKHARLGTETRVVDVRAGQSAQVRVVLGAAAASRATTSDLAPAVSGAAGARRASTPASETTQPSAARTPPGAVDQAP